MTIRPILTVPNPILKQVSKPVEKVTGVPLNVIVMDLARDGEKPQVKYFVNPEILEDVEELNPYEEGCLSVPDVFDTVERPERVKLTYLDYNGERVTEWCEGLYATCIQHEMDHLKGIVSLA